MRIFKTFSLATIKNGLVKDVVYNNCLGEVQWERLFSRKLLNRVECMVEKLIYLVGFIVLNEERKVRSCWIHDNGEIYLLKTCLIFLLTVVWRR